MWETPVYIFSSSPFCKYGTVSTQRFLRNQTIHEQQRVCSLLCLVAHRVLHSLAQHPPHSLGSSDVCPCKLKARREQKASKWCCSNIAEGGQGPDRTLAPLHPSPSRRAPAHSWREWRRVWGRAGNAPQLLSFLSGNWKCIPLCGNMIRTVFSPPWKKCWIHGQKIWTGTDICYLLAVFHVQIVYILGLGFLRWKMRIIIPTSWFF